MIDIPKFALLDYFFYCSSQLSRRVSSNLLSKDLIKLYHIKHHFNSQQEVHNEVKVCRIHIEAVWRTTPSVRHWGILVGDSMYMSPPVIKINVQLQTLRGSCGWNYAMLKSSGSFSSNVRHLWVYYVLRNVSVEVFNTNNTTRETLTFSYKWNYVYAEGLSWLTPSVSSARNYVVWCD
jgi:hypothetical protein